MRTLTIILTAVIAVAYTNVNATENGGTTVFDSNVVVNFTMKPVHEMSQELGEDETIQLNIEDGRGTTSRVIPGSQMRAIVETILQPLLSKYEGYVNAKLIIKVLNQPENRAIHLRWLVDESIKKYDNN